MVLATACGVPLDDRPAPIPADDIPDALVPSATTAPLAPARDDVLLWYVRDTSLVPVRRTIPGEAGATAALQELLAGPTIPEREGNLRTAIADPSSVVGVAVAAGTAVVTLSPSFSEIPAGDQLLAIAQLVLSMTDLRGVGRVHFEIDGQRVAVPLPDGAASSEDVVRDNYIDLVVTER